MLKVYGASGLYRTCLMLLAAQQHSAHAFNVVIFQLNHRILDHYITLTTWLLIITAHITCLVQFELGMFHLTAVFLPRLVGEKILHRHRVIDGTSKVRSRLRHMQATALQNQFQ